MLESNYEIEIRNGNGNGIKSSLGQKDEYDIRK